MLIKTIPVGQLETNCYIVTNEKTLECVVIDPGDESNTILEYLEDNKLRCRAIMLTHGHFDHTGAVESVMEEHPRRRPYTKANALRLCPARGRDRL